MRRAPWGLGLGIGVGLGIRVEGVGLGLWVQDLRFGVECLGLTWRNASAPPPAFAAGQPPAEAPLTDPE